MKTPETLFERYFPYDNTSHDWPQVIAIFIACIASFNLGALFCWPSPAIPVLISNASHIETITIDQASYFSVIPSVAIILISPAIVGLVDNIGRKRTVMLIAIPQFASWMLIAFAENVYVLYASRFLTGLGDATFFASMPTYIGEIATPSVRGSWGNSVSICVYLGQLVVNAVSMRCNIRDTALILGCFPIIHILLMITLPESPYYLLMKNRRDEAEDALQKLRWQVNVDHELHVLTKDVHRQLSETGTFKDLFTIPVNRKALLISIANRGAQQLSGLSAFAVYTQYIFNQAGGHLSAPICAVIFCTVLVIAISIFAFILDKFGRKPMMCVSCIGCCIVLAIEATYFYIAQETDVDVSQARWIPLAGMLCYIVLCASGLGIIPTLMLGELFSTSIKGKALCVLNIFFSLYILSASKLYQTLSHHIGMYVPFYIFSFCCLISTVFSYYYIPETKGKTLEEIQQILGGGNDQKDVEITRC